MPVRSVTLDKPTGKTLLVEDVACRYDVTYNVCLQLCSAEMHSSTVLFALPNIIGPFAQRVMHGLAKVMTAEWWNQRITIW